MTTLSRIGLDRTKSFGFDSEKTTKIDHDSKRFSAFKKMGFWSRGEVAVFPRIRHLLPTPTIATTAIRKWLLRGL
jgi:hypothetical protein